MLINVIVINKSVQNLRKSRNFKNISNMKFAQENSKKMSPETFN